MPDDAAIAMALIENIQRENLNPLEEGRALERLISEFGLTHQQAAEAVGRSRAAVSNLLRLLELPPTRSASGSRSASSRWATRVRCWDCRSGASRSRSPRWWPRKSLSVRETEALVRRMSEPQRERTAGADAVVDPNIRDLQDDLGEKLGATVTIEHAQTGKGRLVVRYNSLDELDGILTHIV